MRLIGSFDHEDEAKKFSTYLQGKGISSKCEASFDATKGQFSYHLWIHDEDQIGTASAALAHFQQTPSDQEFAAKPPPVHFAVKEKTQAQRRWAPVTFFFLFLCTFIFLLNPKADLFNPVQQMLLFDLPPTLPRNEQEMENMPGWKGVYDLIIDKMKKEPIARDEGPLFYRIRQGEIWRLFTPALLHGGLLHLLFNMMWLWVLGIPIEHRIGFTRTLLLTLALGIGSNICQYLVGGPFFLGYSGIVVGLAGFIWMREKKAPWEGYPLPKSTILFLLLFVLGMFSIQLVAFIMQFFASWTFSPHIANTGHISGGLLGLALGKFHFFSQRTR